MTERAGGLRNRGEDCETAWTVLIGVHGKALRATVRHLDGVSNEAIAELNIPAGISLVHELDGDLRSARSAHLGDPEAAKAAAEAVAPQAG